MRLAIDATRVPKLPILMPVIIALKLVLKPVINTAAGTFDIIWEEIMAKTVSLPEIHRLNNEEKKGMFSRLPIKMNNAINVKISR